LHGDGDRGGGWTVDGPNKELGVQIKDLSLVKGKKASIKVTHSLTALHLQFDGIVHEDITSYSLFQFLHIDLIYQLNAFLPLSSSFRASLLLSRHDP
jgi:hypothetical protein